MIFDLSGERQVFSLTGNVWNFLNSLCTKNLAAFRTALNQNAIASYLLNHRGRIVTDLLISKPPSYFQCNNSVNELLVETAVEHVDNFYEVLNRFNFRKEVIFKHFPLKVYSQINGTIKSSSENSINEKQTIYEIKNEPKDSLEIFSFTHPLRLGQRIYCRDLLTGSATDILKYNTERVLQFAVPTSPKDLISGVSLPFESNGDLLGMIDSDKGCYLGQELTARSAISNVIRKRLVPYIITRDSNREDEAFENEMILDTGGNAVGKIISTYQNNEGNSDVIFGFALARQEHELFGKNTNFFSKNYDLQFIKPPYFK